VNSIIKSLDRLDEKKKSRIERVNEYKNAIEQFLEEDPKSVRVDDFGSYASARFTFDNDRVVYLTVENAKTKTCISFGGTLLCSWVYPVGHLDISRTAMAFNGALKIATQLRNEVNDIINAIEAKGITIVNDDHWDDKHTQGHINTSTRLITLPPKGFEPRFIRVNLKNVPETGKFIVLVNGKGSYIGDDKNEIIDTFIKNSKPKLEELTEAEREALGNLTKLEPWIIKRLKRTAMNGKTPGELPFTLGKNSSITETRLNVGPRKIWETMAGNLNDSIVEFYVLVYDGEQAAIFGRSMFYSRNKETSGRIIIKHDSTESKVGKNNKRFLVFNDNPELCRLFGVSSGGSSDIGFKDFSAFLKRIAEKAKETYTNYSFLEVRTDEERLKLQTDRKTSRDGLVPLPKDGLTYKFFLDKMKNDLFNRLKAFKANAYSCKTVDELVKLMTDKTYGLVSIDFDGYPYTMSRINQYDFGQLLFDLYGDFRPNETATQRQLRITNNNERALKVESHVEWSLDRKLSDEEISLLTTAGKKPPPEKISVRYKIKNGQVVPSIIRFTSGSLSSAKTEEFVINESILNEIGIVPDPNHEYCDMAVATFVRNGRADGMAKELIAWKSQTKLGNAYVTRVKLLSSIKKLPLTKKCIDELSEEIYVVADLGHTEEIDKATWSRWLNNVWNMFKVADDRALVAQMMLQAAGKTRAFFSTFNSVASAIFLSNDVDEFKRHLAGDTCSIPAIIEQPSEPSEPPSVNEATDNAKRKLDAIAAFLTNLYDIEMIEQGPRSFDRGFEPWYRGTTKQGLKINLASQGARVKYRFDISESKDEYIAGNDTRAFATAIAKKAAHYDQCAVLRNKFSEGMIEIGLRVEEFGVSRAYTAGSDFAKAHLRVVAEIVTTPSGKPGIKVTCGAYVKFMLGNPANIPKVATGIQEDFNAGDSNWPATKKVLDEILVKPRPLSR
jgi:hypothetical protein